MTALANVLRSLRYLGRALTNALCLIVYVDGILLSGWSYSNGALNPHQRAWRDWWLAHRPSVVHQFESHQAGEH